MIEHVGSGPENPMVSVVVPTFQHAAYIEKCLDSILMQQTTFPVEILIGEDESTDGTREICQRLAEQHPDRIRLFLRSRKDVVYVEGNPTGRGNLMFLLSQAKGKYIAFCEGDDFWTDPNKLAKQVALLEQDRHCMGAYHDTAIVDAGGQVTGRIFRSHLPTQMTLLEVMVPLSPFHFSSFLTRNTPVTAKLPGWMRRVPSFDTAMYPLLIGNGYYAKADGVMSSYRKHQGGITNTPMHTNIGLDKGRIKLWTLFDQHDGYRHTRRAKELFLHHWAGIQQQATPRTRLRYLAELIQAAPTWFLRHPAFTLARLRDCIRR
mgnify:CR=1 FL=1